jgi:diaminopimelate epimerase
MKLDFIKMHGAGNDFVFIDDLSEELQLTEAQVRFLCDRHFGVGADGVILVQPPKNVGSVAYMHYRNDDGSLAEMCGNGVRCFAKYLVDKGFVAANEGRLVVDTLAGKRAITFLTDAEGALTYATVDMGEPAFNPAEIPATFLATATIRTTSSAHDEFIETPALVDMPLATPLGERTFTCVNMGNPHAVTFIEGSATPATLDPTAPVLCHPERSAAQSKDLWTDNVQLTRLDACASKDSSLRDLRPSARNDRVEATPTLTDLDISVAGPALETHEGFPQKANIEFAEVLDPGGNGRDAELRLRVWERGVGETLACGTGACATVVAAAITGRSARSALVHLRGGDLRIEWLDNNHVMMTGPASAVYEGTIRL